MQEQTMDAETLEALKGSIAKWEAIVAGTGTDLGMNNCPLCLRFATDEYNPCTGCPVYARTGSVMCEGSPYDDWLSAQTLADEERAAQAELDFLKSLLPPAPAASTEKGG